VLVLTSSCRDQRFAQPLDGRKNAADQITTDWHLGKSQCCRDVAETKKPPWGRLVILLKSKRVFGSGGRDRTYDQLINSQLLYR
jgi:hypothetical protein